MSVWRERMDSGERARPTEQVGPNGRDIPMRQFEPQAEDEPYCEVVHHPDDCDCGVDPDHEYERGLDI